MPASLDRDLGLYATITVSIGAMVGSGIFVLPALAAKEAGPAVVLAYLLAGLIVLPAALSKAEMATAMPEAGGTYLFIDRAMGPLPGTIAGVGAWFSLVFKSAFAIVGLGAYLLVFVSLSDGVLTVVGLVVAVFLLLVNVVGVKQTGRLQAVIVSGVLLALLGFVGDGMTYVDQANYHPFFPKGAGGLFAATGFVFVSYAGVTKIASVAEEVENPGRNIPIGILSSILVMMAVYTLVAFVVVGVVPIDALLAEDRLTPMAGAARAFAGPLGEVIIGTVAVLALTSMANAGILSSSRFPLAMSRDSLAPPRLSVVSERFGTPIAAIAVTGVLLLALIAFVDVFQLAKLASAFQILVFSIVNAALVAFRESDLDSYDPEFVAPGYPWVQLFGLVAGLALLTQMGTVAIGGAVGLILAGLVWYRVYGRERTKREGAALDAIRRRSGESSIDEIRASLATGTDGGAVAAATDRADVAGGTVLVAVGADETLAGQSTQLEVAAAVAERTDDRIAVVRFEEVPEQVPLGSAAQSDEETFVEETAAVAERLGVPVAAETVVGHDVETALAHYVRDNDVSLVIGEWVPDRFHAEFLGEDVDWYMDNCRSDVVFVRDRGLGTVEEVTVVADRGPYDALEVTVADAVATATGAELRFITALDADATEEQYSSAREYLAAIADATTAPATTDLLRTNDRREALTHAAEGSDLVVASTSAHHLVYDVVFGTLPDALANDLDCTVLLVHEDETKRSTFIRYLLERLVF